MLRVKVGVTCMYGVHLPGVDVTIYSLNKLRRLESLKYTFEL